MPHDPIHFAMRSLLDQRDSRSTRRTLRNAPANSINFSSNDFLSLSTSPVFRSAYLEELTSDPDFKIGSGGSRLLDGNSIYAEQLEQDAATFHGAQAALLFNSGFDANAGFFSCVPQPGDVIVYDDQIHASVHEGMRLSQARARIPFSHNSVRDLRRKLEERVRQDDFVRDGKRNFFVAIEALYSMDGDLAPIRDVVALVEELLPAGNGLVAVDEAHSNGVYGHQGRGIVCSMGLEGRVFARLHTFGKGLACSGGMFPAGLGF